MTQPASVTRLSTRDNAFRLRAQPLAHVLWFSRLREASMGTGCPLDLVLPRHVGCKQPTPGSTSPQPEPQASLRLHLSAPRPSPQPRAASSPGVSPILPQRPWGLMWRQSVLKFLGVACKQPTPCTQLHVYRTMLPSAAAENA